MTSSSWLVAHISHPLQLELTQFNQLDFLMLVFHFTNSLKLKVVFNLRKVLNQVSTPALPVVTSNTRPRSSTSTDSLASWGEVAVQIPFWNIFKIFSRICESLGSTPAGLTLRPSLVLPFRFYFFISSPLDDFLPAGLSIADRFPRPHHSGVPC